MRREGFTLADTLAAMLVIGLAFTGLFQGVRLIAQVQRRNAQDHQALVEDRRVQAVLQGVFRATGGDDGRLAGQLRGSGSAFEFPCGEQTCSAAIAAEGGIVWLRARQGEQSRYARLGPVGGSYRLTYLSRRGRYDQWPAPEAVDDSTLTAVELSRNDLPIGVARVWLEQPVDCNYDLITFQCRMP